MMSIHEIPAFDLRIETNFQFSYKDQTMKYMLQICHARCRKYRLTLVFISQSALGREVPGNEINRLDVIFT